jgi:hypothetical protein
VLRLFQRLRLHQQALSLVTVAAPAETHDHRVSFAICLDAAREQSAPRRKELQIRKTAASQAGRAGIFHDEEVPAAAAAVAFPVRVQRLDHYQLWCAARLLRDALALLLREFR